MTAHIYAWYRVERDDEDTLRVIRGMMARVACRTGIHGRLLRKQDEPRLWMEVYQGVPEPSPFLASLAQVADQCDVGMFVDGRRNEEVFVEDGWVPATCSQAG